MSEQRPAIGICTALEFARWGLWEHQAVLLSTGYINGIQRAGALAIMIPPDPELVENPDEMLDRIVGEKWLTAKGVAGYGHAGRRRAGHIKYRT